jgi:hypothetical protein
MPPPPNVFRDLRRPTRHSRCLPKRNLETRMLKIGCPGTAQSSPPREHLLERYFTLLFHNKEGPDLFPDPGSAIPMHTSYGSQNA